jgi:hypothetical protein
MVSPNSWNNDRLFDLQMKISMTKKKQTKKKAAKSKRNTRTFPRGRRECGLSPRASNIRGPFDHRGRAYERTPLPIAPDGFRPDLSIAAE